MKRTLIYWREALATLQPIVQKSRLGLITDMDGTISHIVPKHDDAQITPRIRELLQMLEPNLALVAVVSGRSVEQLRSLVSLPNLTYVGNHGLERWVSGVASVASEAMPFRDVLTTALDDLSEIVKSTKGMTIEGKDLTLSVHYRQTTDPKSIEMEILPIIQNIATRYGLKLYQGRKVFELRPPIDIDKGEAFRELVVEHSLEAALYLGDDSTDADAMRMAQQLRTEEVCDAIGIVVKSDEMPEILYETADLFVKGVTDVEVFFEWLLNARRNR